MYILTIDSGTTNSRVHLIDLESSELIDVIKKRVGVRNTAIDGTTKALSEGLSAAIEEILTKNTCTTADIAYIVATGMITSNLGILEVPHIPSPGSIDDFVNGSVVEKLPEFFDVPCIFVPGLKNNVSDTETDSLFDHINYFDVMRGEEVEAFGLKKQLGLQGKGLFVLPGSHTKYVMMDNEQITSCLSTLGGEMVYAVQKETILSSSLNDDLVSEADRNLLLEGFKSGNKFGLTRSFYHIRLLQLFEEMNENQRANYFLGSILSADIQALKNTYEELDVAWIVVGGSNPLRKAFIHVLEYMNFAQVIEANDEHVQLSTIIGAKMLGEKRMVDTNH
ncbi:2-dehydro-3-deoxygalactonokinase [Radiobacillus sp. PE A8.2]|uniref:2-dehydro-3-deoxygalactonokinase n=1 Tax=Radiobacillus sp. PE A8.2 TaxID=3380349 RepID=UPI00388F1035